MGTQRLAESLLLEQQDLTAVDRFSQRYAQLSGTIYEDLIPLTKPGAGEQYAFEVDLDACSGCKACVSACHSLNGLDSDESWRDVGLLHGGLNGSATQQFVTSACHHCVDPACANGCPTLAYDKDKNTGIVRHLDDQCMGCRYCELTCPYEVPKYNAKLGIVRKCDMCHSRLAVGEAPACVQACPNEAIKIRVVPQTVPQPGEQLLPGTVTSDYTQPSTRFVNLSEGPVLVPADANSLSPANAHWPLVWMLVMTQAGAGIVAADAVAALDPFRLLIGVVLAFAGLAGSALHLGRPLQGWRGVLGWRRSWLSREILVLGAWGGALLGLALATFMQWPVARSLSLIAGMLGMLGVFCSVKVYAVTRRSFWAYGGTLLRFFGTALATGLLLTGIPWLALIPLVGLLIYEGTLLCQPPAELVKSSRLMLGPLRRWMYLRWLTAGASLATAVVKPEMIWVALTFMLISELSARVLFFQAVDEPKMPGGLAL